MQNGNKMEKEPITNTGLEKLKKELVFLKEKKRPEIIAAIAEARSHGDLKENAEYHAAKEQQSHIEGRIQEINDIIARANVIDVTKIANEGKIIFGSTVYLENLDNGEKLEYTIVGKDEADLTKKLIFFKSPIGQGLIGKRKNDLVEINTPAGAKNFEIFKSKKINKKLINLLDFFKDKEVPIFPIKAKDLMKKYDISEGKLLGIKLKKIEEKWINNNFKVSEIEISQVLKN